MNDWLSLLFVCECSGACAHFQNCMEREGCRLVVATDTERAVRTLLLPHTVDAVVIHNESLREVSLVASGLKLISPQIPIVLLTAEWPINGEGPCGVDAICVPTFLNRRAARDLARFVRQLMNGPVYSMTEQLQFDDRRFAARRPAYLN